MTEVCTVLCSGCLKEIYEMLTLYIFISELTLSGDTLRSQGQDMWETRIWEWEGCHLHLARGPSGPVAPGTCPMSEASIRAVFPGGWEKVRSEVRGEIQVLGDSQSHKESKHWHGVFIRALQSMASQEV